MIKVPGASSPACLGIPPPANQLFTHTVITPIQSINYAIRLIKDVPQFAYKKWLVKLSDSRTLDITGRRPQGKNRKAQLFGGPLCIPLLCGPRILVSL